MKTENRAHEVKTYRSEFAKQYHSDLDYQVSKPVKPEAIHEHKFEYRSIAKMLASASCAELPDVEFKAMVDTFMEVIAKLPQEQKTALKMAYIFSRKAPQQERADLYQELYLKLIKARCADEKLAYAIARCDWKDFWRAYRIHEHFSLDAVDMTSDAEDASDYGQGAIDRIAYHSDLLQGEIELENKVDASILWDRLPKAIKAIVAKRINGVALKCSERVALHRYIKANSTMLASYR
jgi:DNA-directed RNA polymerase specialized sigma24 family protein